MKRSLLFILILTTLAVGLVACGSSPVAEPVIVEKEVVVEKEVIKEVIKEVPGEKVVVEVPVALGGTFKEAPQLAQLVQAGKLPPVQERLPLEPLVMPVFGEIGKYGGIMRRGFLGPTDVSCNAGRMNGSAPLRWNTDGTELVPSVAKSVKPNSDGSVWTIELRKGMKWSDGSAFTADDWMFAYAEVWANDDIHPGKRPWFKGAYENPVVVSKVDETTVKFTYPGPFWIFPKLMQFSCTTVKQPYLPAEYLKQFIPKFNSKAEATAKAAGFESWTKYYLNREDPRDNPDRPSVRAWLFQNTRGEATIHMTRNPYYFAVDAEGNQLPYIDEIRLETVENPEVLMLKAVQGEIDFQGRHIQLPNFPVLKEGEKKGGYKVQLVDTYGGVDAYVALNQSHEGPHGDLLRNQNFRLALSAALDRNFMNEVSMLGLGTVRNALPPPGHPHHPGAEYETKNAVYDTAVANKLLDEIIPNRDGDGFRTLPDGGRLELIVGATPAFGPWPDIAEQSARFWSEVGVRSRADILERSLSNNRHRANEYHAYVWDHDTSADMFMRGTKTLPLDQGSHIAPGWGRWYNSGGKDGIEPSAEMKSMLKMYERGQTLPANEAAVLARDIYKWHAENQVLLGIAGMSPMVMGVVVVNENLANVPDSWANDVVFNTPWPAFPEQFFYRN